MRVTAVQRFSSRDVWLAACRAWLRHSTQVWCHEHDLMCCTFLVVYAAHRHATASPMLPQLGASAVLNGTAALRPTSEPFCEFRENEWPTETGELLAGRGISLAVRMLWGWAGLRSRFRWEIIDTGYCFRHVVFVQFIQLKPT